MFQDIVNGKKLFELPITWSFDPQPINDIIEHGEIDTLTDLGLVQSSSYIDIPVDEREELNVCYRVINDIRSIGCSHNSTWIFGEEVPERTLTTGEYIVIVNIKHNGGSFQSKFLLQNPDDISGYTLLPYSVKAQFQKNLNRI